MDIQLCLADEVLDEFSMEKTGPRYGRTSGPLSEEVVDKSVDSEATSLSSPHT